MPTHLVPLSAIIIRFSVRSVKNCQLQKPVSQVRILPGAPPDQRLCRTAQEMHKVELTGGGKMAAIPQRSVACQAVPQTTQVHPDQPLCLPGQTLPNLRGKRPSDGGQPGQEPVWLDLVGNQSAGLRP